MPGSTALAYDPMDRLFELSVAGTGTRFLYDGVQAIGEYNASGTLLRRYVPGPALDEPVTWYEGSGTSDRRWLVADQLGTVVAVTDGSGAATNINTFDEYGQPGVSNAGRFQYTGQAWLAEAGLQYSRARAYAPTIGRFLQTDPILQAGGINLYAYVGNDPVNFTDPGGMGKDPFVDEIIVQGLRWYEDPQYIARQAQYKAQELTRSLQGVGGADAGEVADPNEVEGVVVTAPRPGPAIRGTPSGFILVQGGNESGACALQYMQCLNTSLNLATQGQPAAARERYAWCGVLRMSCTTTSDVVRQSAPNISGIVRGGPVPDLGTVYMRYGRPDVYIPPGGRVPR